MIKRLTPNTISYCIEGNKIRIGDFYYNKDTIDKELPIPVNACYLSPAEWAKMNNILNVDDIGINSENGYIKVGNGIDHWEDIQYTIFPIGSDIPDLPSGKSNIDNDTMIQLIDDLADYRSFIVEEEYNFITSDDKVFSVKDRIRARRGV